DGLLCLLEFRLNLTSNPHVRHVDLERRNGSRGFAGFGFVGSIRTRLKRRQNRWRTRHSNIGVDLALKDLPREYDIASFNTEAHAVGDKGFSKYRRQLWSEVANLICMAQDNQSRIELLDHLLERRHVPIGGVLGDLVVLHGMDGIEFL